MPYDSSPANGTLAPLRNVALFAELTKRVLGRSPGLPGLASFTGFSGYGKSFAAIYSSNRHRGYPPPVSTGIAL
jgi:hypothetical protein